MKERFICPQCGAGVSADSSFIGRKVRCPKCKAVFQLSSNNREEIGLLEDAPSDKKQTSWSPDSSASSSALNGGSGGSNPLSSTVPVPNLSESGSTGSTNPLSSSPIAVPTSSSSSNPYEQPGAANPFEKRSTEAAPADTFGLASSEGFDDLDKLVQLENQSAARSDVSRPRKGVVPVNKSEDEDDNDSLAPRPRSQGASEGRTRGMAELEKTRAAFMRAFLWFVGLLVFSAISISVTPPEMKYVIIASPLFLLIVSFVTLVRYFKMCSLIWGPVGAIAAIACSILPLVGTIVFICALVVAYGSGGKAGGERVKGEKVKGEKVKRPPRPFYKSPVLIGIGIVIATFFVITLIFTIANVAIISSNQKEKNSGSAQLEQRKNYFAERAAADAEREKKEEEAILNDPTTRKVGDFPNLTYAVTDGQLDIAKLVPIFRQEVRRHDSNSDEKLNAIEFARFYNRYTQRNTLEKDSVDNNNFFKVDHQKALAESKSGLIKTLPVTVTVIPGPGQPPQNFSESGPFEIARMAEKHLPELAIRTAKEVDADGNNDGFIDSREQMRWQMEIDEQTKKQRNNVPVNVSGQPIPGQPIPGSKVPDGFTPPVNPVPISVNKTSEKPGQGNSASNKAPSSAAKMTKGREVSSMPVTIHIFFKNKPALLVTEDGPFEIAKMAEKGIPKEVIELAKDVDKNSKRGNNDGFIDFHENFELRSRMRKLKL